MLNLQLTVLEVTLGKMTVRKLGNIGEDDMLPICSSEDCKKIRIEDDPQRWLSREENQDLYDRYLGAYGIQVSHTYCSRDCFGGFNLKELDRSKKADEARATL